MKKRWIYGFLCLCLTGCGYRRLDRNPSLLWAKRGTSIRIASFRNQSTRMGLEEPFRQALENRIVAASPWTLVPASSQSNLILQASLHRYELRPLGLSLGTGRDKGSAGTASRVEVIVTASVELLDGQTGVTLVKRPELTFSNQYRLDQNFASFDNREVQVIESLADDFAESFLTQVLEGEP